jgi:hypothetical protein
MEKTQQVTIRKSYQLSDPTQMMSMANVLKSYIIKNKLYTNIVGKNYVHVEGWQFAGGLLGTFPKVISVESLSNSQEVKWKAEVEVIDIKTGKTISSGFAVCSNKETKKKSFDEYAVLSMAQTRAIGKAYRNVIGWVIKLAGYEGTPAEEAGKVGDVDVENTQSPKSQEKVTKEIADKLLMMMVNHGFGSKTKAIVGINRLLKTNIKEITDLTVSQAKTVEVACLQKKHQGK